MPVPAYGIDAREPLFRPAAVRLPHLSSLRGEPARSLQKPLRTHRCTTHWDVWVKLSPNRSGTTPIYLGAGISMQPTHYMYSKQPPNVKQPHTCDFQTSFKIFSARDAPAPRDRHTLQATEIAPAYFTTTFSRAASDTMRTSVKFCARGYLEVLVGVENAKMTICKGRGRRRSAMRMWR